MNPAQVRITAHFRENLEGIETFLREAGAEEAFNALLDDLMGTVIPNLEQFPEMGRDFLTRGAGSVEVSHALAALRSLSALHRLREYILPPFLLLYAADDHTVHLLSIRHHRQLSFDFPRLWGDV